ncbi:MAG: phosphoribosylformylglycinamidine synthase subunit PurQ, partial [Firmicutes bacterium]|nr:phosphoribosylformylglycinamidine synthase subunit PurQ [Bacillota bacterium]
ETKAPAAAAAAAGTDFVKAYEALASDLNICSKRGLSERFDSTIGAGTVLMPFGGKNQLTPIQAMVQKVSVETGDTDDVSFMSWGYDPQLSSENQFKGAYSAVVDSVCMLVATGASFEDVYLSFQEYFGKPARDPKRWAAPLGALLGAFEAQKDLGIAAIGGKDSMSGTFGDMDVPPTLISFAVTTGKLGEVISPEFKAAGHRAVLLAPEFKENGLPEAASLLALFDKLTDLMRAGKVASCWATGRGGMAEGVMKQAFGNGFGFRFEDGLSVAELFAKRYGAFVVELNDGAELPEGAVYLGQVTAEPAFVLRSHRVDAGALLSLYENKLEGVYTCNSVPEPDGALWTDSFGGNLNRKAPAVKVAKPKVIIPVFPGTNCEFDSAKAVRAAGAEAEILVIKNRTADGIKESTDALAKAISESQMIFLPGGFSAADEPDGSGKFITAIFRNEAIKEQVTALLEQRDGLICGICNGFQALVKLGLVPYGKIIDTDADCPTLTFNTIARHQSRIVRVRVASNKSPWLSLTNVGDVYSVPISHGEGRFLASDAMVKQLAENGQIATQYVDFDDEATKDIHFNINGSACAIEGITSPDGRVFGKMGHSERIGSGLYLNVPGNYDIRMFEAAVRYFR